jgi:dolichyl-phosphate-mannose-protein mannosyltransferase
MGRGSVLRLKLTQHRAETAVVMDTQPVSPQRQGIFERLACHLDSGAGVVAIFTLALMLRLLLVPNTGFYGDLGLFKEWTSRLAQVGPRHFYVHGQLQDYPPGYLYLLWFTGKISATPGYLALKLPAILADLGLAWIAGTFAARIAPAQLARRWPVRKLVAASILFNPAIIVLSAVWGQVDSVPAMFVLWSLLLLFTGERSLSRDVTAFLLFAVAFAIKPQAAFVLPVMLYVLYRRYIYRRPRPEWFGGALRIAAVGAPSLILWANSGLAFGLDPLALLRFYRHSTTIYPVTSANAFNIWGAAGFWRDDSTGDNVLRVAGVPSLYVGTSLFLAALTLTLWWVHRALDRGADEARVLMVGAAAVSLLAFLTLTRMHERYMFLSLICLAPLIVARALRPWYAALCGLFVINLWLPYGSQWSSSAPSKPEPLFSWVFGTTTDAWQKTVLSLAVTGVGLMVLSTGLRWAGRPVAEAAPVSTAPRPGPDQSPA